MDVRRGRSDDDLAVVSALVVAALILAASRALLVGGIEAGEEVWREQFANPLIGLPQLLWPLWGVALAVAAMAYQRRRRIADQENRELDVDTEGELRGQSVPRGLL